MKHTIKEFTSKILSLQYSPKMKVREWEKKTTTIEHNAKDCKNICFMVTNILENFPHVVIATTDKNLYLEYWKDGIKGTAKIKIDNLRNDILLPEITTIAAKFGKYVIPYKLKTA